jgi:hypothetical protein
MVNASRISFRLLGFSCKSLGRHKMEPISPDVTSLLKKLADGNQEAARELIPGSCIAWQ